MNYVSYRNCVCNTLCGAKSQPGQKELVSVFMCSYDQLWNVYLVWYVLYQYQTSKDSEVKEDRALPKDAHSDWW